MENQRGASGRIFKCARHGRVEKKESCRLQAETVRKKSLPQKQKTLKERNCAVCARFFRAFPAKRKRGERLPIRVEYRMRTFERAPQHDKRCLRVVCFSFFQKLARLIVT